MEPLEISKSVITIQDAVKFGTWFLGGILGGAFAFYKWLKGEFDKQTASRTAFSTKVSEQINGFQKELTGVSGEAGKALGKADAVQETHLQTATEFRREMRLRDEKMEGLNLTVTTLQANQDHTRERLDDLSGFVKEEFRRVSDKLDEVLKRLSNKRGD